MDMDELAVKIAMLEGRNAEMDAANEFNGFMDTYGQYMSDDADIGMHVLNEFSRRGVDMGRVTFEAVQEVLDGLRQEAAAVMDKIKMDQRQVADLMDQVQTISESVAAATGAVPGAEMDTGLPPPPADEVAADIEGLGAPPMDDMGAPPMDDMGAPPPMDDMGAPPPMDDMAMLPPEDPNMLPPDQMLSDMRMKQIKTGVRKVHSAARSTSSRPTQKFGSHIVTAIKGGS